MSCAAHPSSTTRKRRCSRSVDLARRVGDGASRPMKRGAAATPTAAMISVRTRPCCTSPAPGDGGLMKTTRDCFSVLASLALASVAGAQSLSPHDAVVVTEDGRDGVHGPTLVRVLGDERLVIPREVRRCFGLSARSAGTSRTSTRCSVSTTRFIFQLPATNGVRMVLRRGRNPAHYRACPRSSMPVPGGIPGAPAGAPGVSRPRVSPVRTGGIRRRSRRPSRRRYLPSGRGPA